MSKILLLVLQAHPPRKFSESNIATKSSLLVLLSSSLSYWPSSSPALRISSTAIQNQKFDLCLSFKHACSTIERGNKWHSSVTSLTWFPKLTDAIVLQQESGRAVRFEVSMCNDRHIVLQFCTGTSIIPSSKRSIKLAAARKMAEQKKVREG